MKSMLTLIIEAADRHFNFAHRAEDDLIFLIDVKDAYKSQKLNLRPQGMKQLWGGNRRLREG